MISSLIVTGLIVAVIIYVIVAYNGFVSLRERIKEAWSGIEVQMKLRYNLIPNLVETVKGMNPVPLRLSPAPGARQWPIRAPRLNRPNPKTY